MNQQAEITLLVGDQEVVEVVDWVDEATSVNIAVGRVTADWSLYDRMEDHVELVGVRVLDEVAATQEP